MTCRCCAKKLFRGRKQSYYDNDLEKHDFNDNEGVKKGMRKAMGLSIREMTKFQSFKRSKADDVNWFVLFLNLDAVSCNDFAR